MNDLIDKLREVVFKPGDQQLVAKAKQDAHLAQLRSSIDKQLDAFGKLGKTLYMLEYMDGRGLDTKRLYKLTAQQFVETFRTFEEMFPGPYVEYDATSQSRWGMLYDFDDAEGIEDLTNMLKVVSTGKCFTLVISDSPDDLWLKTYGFDAASVKKSSNAKVNEFYQDDESEPEWDEDN